MKCSRCQHDNPEGQRFCGDCGERLGLLCPSCGATSGPEQRFCTDCGASLGPSPFGAPDRYTPPLVMVDEGFEANVFALAARRLMSQRGYNPKAGADQEIVEQAQRADEYFKACGSGAGGKRVTPLFVDSKQNAVQDSTRVTSNPAADTWTRFPYGRQAWR